MNHVVHSIHNVEIWIGLQVFVEGFATLWYKCLFSETGKVELEVNRIVHVCIVLVSIDSLLNSPSWKLQFF